VEQVRDKKVKSLLLLIVLVSTALGNQEKLFRDALGTPYSPSSPPQRIVSLAPNITEILFALDLEERIVGVTRYCDYPPKALAKEKIGGMVDPNLEKIKSLNPDLVIGFRGNPLRILERLKKLKTPVFVLEMGSNFESVFAIIETVGKITKTERKAEVIITSMKKKYSKLQLALQSVIHKPKVFLSLHGMGLWTCGKESFLHDLLIKAKGVNIAGRISRKWLNYNQEQLIHDNPEIIVILAKSEKEFAQAGDWIRRGSHLESLRAVQEDRIYFLDQNLATRPGPRLIDALAQLGRLFHPEQFKEIR
jgi:iron complex transport system substrate-binding protein